MLGSVCAVQSGWKRLYCEPGDVGKRLCSAVRVEAFVLRARGCWEAFVQVAKVVGDVTE